MSIMDMPTTQLKFSDYEYKRPDVEAYRNGLTDLLNQLEQSAGLENQIELMEKISAFRKKFNSMYTICSVRHSIDTRDKFYDAENTFFDETYPELEELENRYYQILLDSKFRAGLEAKFGQHLFVLAELKLKSFEPVILEDIKQENKLSTSYQRIKAQAVLELEGKKLNLSSIESYVGKADRELRKKANEAKWGFYAGKAEEIEKIYDDLVHVRHNMAKKMGHENFVKLGYMRLRRSDYTSEQVANFRKQVLEHIVPIATSLYERQAKRIGVEKLKYYDEPFVFPSGNPRPKGEETWMREQAVKMYKELSPETDEFFTFMSDRELMDLSSKDGKRTGGYCTFIGQEQAPFIFSNFNGTSHDVEVLTHEAGHAFQCYSTSRTGVIDEYLWPTLEACEIHSMSMEFFTWPWMNLFFKEDNDKFKFSHLASSLTFLPYGVAVDEFQHRVYENPNMTPKERNAVWKSIEAKYLPHRDYDGNAFLEGGGFWQRQSHIFGSPFYYIDYTLAQICAFQFWKRSQENHDSAWADYLKLCKLGGTQAFSALVKEANLRSPFEDGCVESVIEPIKNYLDSIDDSSF